MNSLAIVVFTMSLIIAINGQRGCSGQAAQTGKTLLNGFCKVSSPNTDHRGRCVRKNMLSLGTNNKLGERCINDQSDAAICAGEYVNENSEEYLKAGCCMGRVVQKEGFAPAYNRILEGCGVTGRNMDFNF